MYSITQLFPPTMILTFSLEVPAQQAYTIEKIEPNAFTSAQVVEAMMRDLEELFAARFST